MADASHEGPLGPRGFLEERQELRRTPSTRAAYLRSEDAGGAEWPDHFVVTHIDDPEIPLGWRAHSRAMGRMAMGALMAVMATFTTSNFSPGN